MDTSWNGRFHRLVLFFAMIPAVSSGLGAVWMFAIVGAGTGSYEGNILRVGIGLMLVLISLLIFGTAAIYFAASETRTDTRYDARS